MKTKNILFCFVALLAVTVLFSATAMAGRVTTCSNYMARDYDLNKDGDTSLSACDNKNYSGGLDVAYVDYTVIDPGNSHPGSTGTRCYLKVEDGNFDTSDNYGEIRVALYAYTGKYLGTIATLTNIMDGNDHNVYAGMSLWSQSVKLNPVTDEIYFSYTCGTSNDYFYKCAWDPADPFGKTPTMAVKMDWNWEVEFDSTGKAYYAGVNGNTYPHGVYTDDGSGGLTLIFSIPQNGSSSNSASCGFAIDGNIGDGTGYFWHGTYYGNSVQDHVYKFDSVGTQDTSATIDLAKPNDDICGHTIQWYHGCNDVECDPDGNVYVTTNGFDQWGPMFPSEGTLLQVASSVKNYLGHVNDIPSQWDWFRGLAYDGASNIDAGGKTDPTSPPPTGNRIYLDMDFDQAAYGGSGPDTIVGIAYANDPDGDGVPDSIDNAPDTPNGGLGVNTANQQDTDSDMYGNICDGDFDNTGSVGPMDFDIFGDNFNQNIPPGDPDVDMDSSDRIGPADFTEFRSRFNTSAPWF